jgi:hypothetical protein
MHSENAGPCLTGTALGREQDGGWERISVGPLSSAELGTTMTEGVLLKSGPGGSASSRHAARYFIPEIGHRTTEEILGHPGYMRMRRHYIATTLANYDRSRFPGGLQSAAYRVAALGSIVCLHAAHDPAERATWPTLARFKQAVGVIGLSSPRQLDDLVAHLSATGHVVLERPAFDGRLRFLRPTEKLLAWDREVLCTYYDALEMLYPVPGYGPAIAREPDFHLAQRRAAVRMFDVIARFFAENDVLMPMHGMNNGVHALMLLADAKADDSEAPVRETDFRVLRTRFGMSRSHIRNIFVVAQAHGLITRSGMGRREIDITRAGLASLNRFIADTLASHDMTYRMALQQTNS